MKTSVEVKETLGREMVVRSDLAYLSESIESWWKNRLPDTPLYMLKLQLTGLILENLRPEHARQFGAVGKGGVAGVCWTNLFSSDDYKMALVVHEALCDLFCLDDIQYEYEAHKALFLKKEGLLYRDWGNGYGDIAPHSDDLYENDDTELLALTVCRDETKTPTAAYRPYDIIRYLDDSEIELLQSEPYIFQSGKNVDIHKQREQLVLSSCNGELHVSMDFRIDSVVGERMIARSDRGARVLEKMRALVKEASPIHSVPDTGTYFVLSNRKLLHARSVLSSLDKTKFVSATSFDFSHVPRLLYRSKGGRKKLSLQEQYAEYLPSDDLAMA